MQCLGDPSETLDVLLQLFGAPKEKVQPTESKTEWALSAAYEKQARNRQKVLLRLEALPPGDVGLLCYVDWCNAQAEGRRPTEERVSRYINEFARPQHDRICLHKIRLSTTSNSLIGANELLIDPVLRLQQRLSSSLERPRQTITKPKSWSTTSTETASPPPSPQQKLQRSITNNWMSSSTESTYPISSIYFSEPLVQDENAQEVPVSDVDRSMEMALSSTPLSHDGTIHFVENNEQYTTVSSAANTKDSSASGSSSQPRRRKAASSVSQRPKKNVKAVTNAKNSVIRTPTPGSKDTNGEAHVRFRAEEFKWPILKAGTGTNPIEKAPIHSLSHKVQTVPEILQEWRYGIDGGASVQDLNREYGRRWRHPADKSNYDRRLAIVKEFVHLVQEDGLSNEKALRSLQTLQGTSSMNVFYKTIIGGRRRRTGKTVSVRKSKAVKGKATESASQTAVESAGHTDPDMFSLEAQNAIDDMSALENVSTLEEVSTHDHVSTLDIAAEDSPADGCVLDSSPAEVVQPAVDSPKKGKRKKAGTKSTAPATMEDVANTSGFELDIAPQSKATRGRKKTTEGGEPTSVASRSTNPMKVGTAESETVAAYQSKVTSGSKKTKRGKVSPPEASDPALEIFRVHPEEKKEVTDSRKRKRGKQADNVIAADPPTSDLVFESQSTGDKKRKRAKNTDVAALPSTASGSENAENQKPSKRRGTKKVDNAPLSPATEDFHSASSRASEEADVQRSTRSRSNQSKAASAAARSPSAEESSPDSTTPSAEASPVAESVPSIETSSVTAAAPSTEASPATAEESPTTKRRKDRRRRSTSPCKLEWTPFPVRNLTSVKDVWTEWTVGWKGEPPMESLVKTYGRVWLGKQYKHQYIYFYCRERCVKSIREAVDKGSVSSAEEAIVLMDEIRGSMSLSYLLNHELFRNTMDSWGLRFARKRKEKEPGQGSELEQEPQSES